VRLQHWTSAGWFIESRSAEEYQWYLTVQITDGRGTHTGLPFAERTCKKSSMVNGMGSGKLDIGKHDDTSYRIYAVSA
jgi:hypothetical protein